MKRLVCLLLVVSIAFAGCYDVEIDKLTGLPAPDKPTEVAKQNKGPIKATQIRGPRGWMDEWDMITQLGWRIEALEEGLREVKAEPKQIEALLVRISVLESALESQRRVEKEQKALVVRIDDLEFALESQRTEIESSENVYRLYEVAIDSQKVAIESLEKLCRMYEAEIESQGKSRNSEESPQSKEPEAEEKQRDENHGQDDGVGLPDGL